MLKGISPPFFLEPFSRVWFRVVEVCSWERWCGVVWTGSGGSGGRIRTGRNPAGRQSLTVWA